jgi:hypothetical protein
VCVCVCTLGGLGALALNVSVELVDDNDVVVSPISDEVSLDDDDDDDDDDVCCYLKKQRALFRSWMWQQEVCGCYLRAAQSGR